MRPVAVILLLICLAAAGLTGYLYFTANVTVADITCVAVDAADRRDVFQELKKQTENDTFAGTPFDTANLGEAEDYQFYEYTVLLRNKTFVKAEVAEIQVTPMHGDVLQTADFRKTDIPARGEGQITATILTAKGTHNVRELTLTYYLWGLPFSSRVTYSR